MNYFISLFRISFNLVFSSKNVLTLKVPTLQNGQTHSNNSSAVVNKLLECVGPFCGVGA